MDYTSIHIYGHLLSDDILHEIETESSMQGNREQDFNLDVSLTAKIDNAWSSLRNDWKLFSERNSLRDHTERKLYVVSWNGSFRVLIIS